MRLSPKFNLLFLANPKCGSTTIRNILDEQISRIDENYIRGRKKGEMEFWNHMKASDVLPLFKKHGWEWDSFFKFTVIRNPFSKAVSNYFYAKPDKNGTPFYRPGYKKRSAFKMAFPDWLEQFCSNEKSLFRIENFCYDGEGRCLLDHIIKMEDMDKTLPEILRKAGIRISQVPVKNKSVHRPYWEYYKESTRKLVEEFFAEDIRVGQYQFGEQ
jgi:hypothetical protein